MGEIMRFPRFVSHAILIVLQLIFVSGCTAPVSPIVTQSPSKSLGAYPAVYLQAAVQRTRILESMRNARIRIAGSFEEADYILSVNVGSRRVKMECGGMHNIIYTLTESGFPLMQIKGRGLTGDCTPNVFDEMSETLATYF